VQNCLLKSLCSGYQGLNPITKWNCVGADVPAEQEIIAGDIVYRRKFLTYSAGTAAQSLPDRAQIGQDGVEPVSNRWLFFTVFS